MNILNIRFALSNNIIIDNTINKTTTFSSSCFIYFDIHHFIQDFIQVCYSSSKHKLKYYNFITNHVFYYTSLNMCYVINSLFDMCYVTNNFFKTYVMLSVAFLICVMLQIYKTNNIQR